MKGVNRFLRFAGMGGVSCLINLGLTALLHEILALPEELAYAISLVTVFTVNFFACRFIVFDAHLVDIRRQLGLFAVSSLAFRGAEFFTFLVLHTLLRIPYLLAIVIVQGTSFVAKFVLYDRFVFRTHKDLRLLR